MSRLTLFLIGLCAGLAAFSAVLAVLDGSAGGDWVGDAVSAAYFALLAFTWVSIGKTERRRTATRRDQDGGES